MRVWLSTVGAVLVLGLVVAANAQQGDKKGLPDLRPNAEWQEMPTKPNKNMSGRAWADLAAGCHLAVFKTALPSAASADKISESMAAALAKSDYQLSPTEDKSGYFDLSGFNVTGLATLELQGSTSATVTACYWNDREPSYCRSLCNQALTKANP